MLKGDLNIKDMVLSPYKEYMEDFINLDLKKGVLDSKIQVDIKGEAQNIKGDIKLSNLGPLPFLEK